MEASNNSSNLASSVAQAIAVSLDWSSTPDARKAAVAFLESVLFFLSLKTLSCAILPVFDQNCMWFQPLNCVCLNVFALLGFGSVEKEIAFFVIVEFNFENRNMIS